MHKNNKQQYSVAVGNMVFTSTSRASVKPIRNEISRLREIARKQTPDSPTLLDLQIMAARYNPMGR